MSDFTYYSPLDVSSALRSRIDVGEFISHLIGNLLELVKDNGNVSNFIPPVVYSERGYVFNVDYNFLVKCLADWLGDSAIEGDFKLTDVSSHEKIKNGMFLIVGILENYHEVVRVRLRKIDCSKFKTSKPFDITDKFYNVVVIRNGQNLKRFSAVPFSASILKGILSDETYSLLVSLSHNPQFTQELLGVLEYQKFVKANGFEVEHVTA